MKLQLKEKIAKWEISFILQYLVIHGYFLYLILHKIISSKTETLYFW